MQYTLFFSRMREGFDQEAYEETSRELRTRVADRHPGFMGIKTYVAEDGERLSVARFRHAASQEAWGRDPVHRAAQREARQRFYEGYEVVVCQPLWARSWQRGEEPRAGASLRPDSVGGGVRTPHKRTGATGRGTDEYIA